MGSWDRCLATGEDMSWPWTLREVPAIHVLNKFILVLRTYLTGRCRLDPQEGR